MPLLEWSWYCPTCKAGAFGEDERPDPHCYGCGGKREIEEPQPDLGTIGDLL